MDRVYFCVNDGGDPDGLTLPREMDRLAEAETGLSDLRLVVLDPLVAQLDVHIDNHRDKDTRLGLLIASVGVIRYR